VRFAPFGSLKAPVPVVIEWDQYVKEISFCVPSMKEHLKTT